MSRDTALQMPTAVTLLHDTSQEGEAFASMYERGGLMTTEDGALTLLAGATAGGGTRVNWLAPELCLPFQVCSVSEQGGMEPPLRLPPQCSFLLLCSHGATCLQWS